MWRRIAADAAERVRELEVENARLKAILDRDNMTAQVPGAQYVCRETGKS